MISPADRIPNTSPNVEADEVILDDIPETDDVEKPSENIEFEKVEQGLPARSRGFRLNWLILIICSIAGVAWMIWENYWVGPNPNQVPLVKAPDGPYKLRPSTPGGMPIPNRDKTVYDTFGKKTLQTGTETLLPEPEQPLPAPEPLISNQKKDKLRLRSPLSSGVENLLNSSQSLPKSSSTTKFGDSGELDQIRTPIAPMVSPSKSQRVDKINKEKSKLGGFINPTTQQSSKMQNKIISESLPSSFSKASFQIQLAAVREQGAAKTEWRRLKTRHNNLLGNLTLNVVRADLGSKGIYFRLRAGPLKDKGAANKLCKELLKVKVSCLIVRPGK